MPNTSTPPRPPKARILVVDDHPLYRDGLREFIDSQPDMECCGFAETCVAALQSAASLKPDLVILDLRLGNQDGVSIISELRALRPPSRVLVLSQRDETAQAGPVLRAGAQGYIMKEEATDELLHAVRTVLRDELYVSRRLSALMLKKFFDGSADGDIASKLTDRELQIFQFLGAGLGNQQIADQLHLSVKTVETHRENIKHKLNLPDAATLHRVARDWLDSTDR
jgi:DNA-binding NarL/FixJ family response regulator